MVKKRIISVMFTARSGAPKCQQIICINNKKKWCRKKANKCIHVEANKSHETELLSLTFVFEPTCFMCFFSSVFIFLVLFLFELFVLFLSCSFCSIFTVCTVLLYSAKHFVIIFFFFY